MFHKLVLCCVISFCFSSSMARQPVAAYRVVQDTASFNPGRSSYEILADGQPGYTIAQIRSGRAAGLFHQDDGIYPAEKTAWWMRQSLKNTLRHEVRLLLPALGTETAAYLEMNGRISVLRSGEAISWPAKDGYKRLNLLPVTLPPGDSVMIYKKETFGYLSRPAFDAAIGTEREAAILLSDGGWYATSVLVSVIAGMILMAMGLSLFFYLRSREIANLWFLLFLLCELLTFTEFLDDTVFRNHPAWVRGAGTAASFIMVIFQVLLVHRVLSVRKNRPAWDGLLMALALLTLLSGAISMSVAAGTKTTFGLEATQFLGYLPVFGLFITTAACLADKDPVKHRTALAAMPVFFWWGAGYFLAFICRLSGYRNNIFYDLFLRVQDGVEILAMSWFTLVFLAALSCISQKARVSG